MSEIPFNQRFFFLNGKDILDLNYKPSLIYLYDLKIFGQQTKIVYFAYIYVLFYEKELYIA